MRSFPLRLITPSSGVPVRALPVPVSTYLRRLAQVSQNFSRFKFQRHIREDAALAKETETFSRETRLVMLILVLRSHEML